MKTCLLFGAGASLANAEYFHRERLTSKNPPLDKTFFAKIRDLGVSVPADLRAYAETLPTGSPFDSRMPQARMEEFFKDLFFDFTDEALSTDQVEGAYTGLIDVYRRVISETTDWLNLDKRNGAPVGRLIAHSFKESDQTILLTFNQDLVIENEIYKRAKLRSSWCLEHGYGAIGANATVLNTGAKRTFDSHSSDCDGGSRLSILKLHGSLNWLVRMNGRRPSRRVLTGQSGPSQIQITRRRQIPQQLRFSKKRRTGRGRSVWYMWPVIVPPIYNKQALIRRFIPAVWGDARSALESCDRLVLFGYSLPPTDIEAEKLIQRSVYSNSDLRWIDVVNPDPKAAARFASLLPEMSLRWYPNVGAFLGLDGR